MLVLAVCVLAGALFVLIPLTSKTIGLLACALRSGLLTLVASPPFHAVYEEVTTDSAALPVMAHASGADSLALATLWTRRWATSTTMSRKTFSVSG